RSDGDVVDVAASGLQVVQHDPTFAFEWLESFGCGLLAEDALLPVLDPARRAPARHAIEREGATAEDPKDPCPWRPHQTGNERRSEDRSADDPDDGEAGAVAASPGPCQLVVLLLS